MTIDKKQEELAKAAADLVLRELDEIEVRDIFGGDGGWVKVGGPVAPDPPTSPGQPVPGA